jgi:hypothetical protein
MLLSDEDAYGWIFEGERKIYIEMVRFQVLTTASEKMTVFWDTAPCRAVEIY